MADIGQAPTFTDQAGKIRTAQGVFGDVDITFDAGDVLRVVVLDLDTAGNPVPTYKAQVMGYDGSNNLQTITITDGADSWVRTYIYNSGNQTGDSGWVKQ